MRYFSIILLFFSISVSASTTAAIQLTQLLNRFISLKANFTEKTIDSQENVIQKSEGVMMLKRPNCFSWQTLKPMHQLVITDGKNLWVYDRGLEQATRESMKSIPINPAKILSGDAYHLMKEFHVRMIPHKTVSVFELIPIQSDPAFQSIAIAFLNGKLLSMHIVTSLNQLSVFDFSHVEVNPHLNSSLFYFVPPKNTQVLK